MKSTFPLPFSAAAVLAAVTLTGCATGATDQHRQHPPESAASASHGHMGMKGGHMGSGMMMSEAEMKSMCDMHMKMMSAKTPEERKAMMDEHMKTMSPQMKQHHMEMMQMMQEHMKSQPPSK